MVTSTKNKDTPLKDWDFVKLQYITIQLRLRFF